MIMMGDRKNKIAAILGDSVKVKSPEAMDELEAAVQEMLDAISNKDVPGLASAFRACFAICESQPHEEGPHTGEE